MSYIISQIYYLNHIRNEFQLFPIITLSQSHMLEIMVNYGKSQMTFELSIESLIFKEWKQFSIMKTRKLLWKENAFNYYKYNCNEWAWNEIQLQ